MLWAILSDIHANLEAFQAVLYDIDSQGKAVSDIYCLGDLIGYGPDPEACLDLAFERCKGITPGNHDLRLLKIFYDLQEKPLEDNALWDMHQQMALGGVEGLMIAGRRMFMNYAKLTNLQRPSAKTHKEDRRQTLDFLAQMLAADFDEKIIEQAAQSYEGQLGRKPTVQQILADNGLVAAAASIEWQRENRTIGLKRLERLSALKPKLVLPINYRGKRLTVGMQHTNPRYPFRAGDHEDPFNEKYLLSEDNPGYVDYTGDGRALDAARTIAHAREDISFYGHSHFYHQVEMTGKRGINVGTVGLQRVRTNMTEPIVAEYVLFNTNTLEVIRRKVPFNYERTQQKAFERGLPDKFKKLLKVFETPERLD